MLAHPLLWSASRFLPPASSALTTSLPLSGPLALVSPFLALLRSASPHSFCSLVLLLLPWPPSPSARSFRPYLPPRRPGPLFLSLCLPSGLRVTPAPCHAGSESATSLAVLGRPGNSSWFLEKTTGAERKALSLPGCPPPSLGPRGLSQSRPARGRKPCGFWLLPGGLRIWPPPPGQQPKSYSAGGVGGGGRRPRLKEAFRAARPGASCPQARASGRPRRDLRWPEGRVLL